MNADAGKKIKTNIVQKRKFEVFKNISFCALEGLR
jgi:hypothetical protein